MHKWCQLEKVNRIENTDSHFIRFRSIRLVKPYTVPLSISVCDSFLFSFFFFLNFVIILHRVQYEPQQQIVVLIPIDFLHEIFICIWPSPHDVCCATFFDEHTHAHMRPIWLTSPNQFDSFIVSPQSRMKLDLMWSNQWIAFISIFQSFYFRWMEIVSRVWWMSSKVLLVQQWERSDSIFRSASVWMQYQSICDMWTKADIIDESLNSKNQNKKQ